MKQLEHSEVIDRNSMAVPGPEIILYLDRLRTPANIAGIFRLANIFKVAKIYIDAEQELQFSKSFNSIARENKLTTPFTLANNNNGIHILQSYRKENYQIVGLEYTSTSTPLDQRSKEAKLVLVLGNERQGISDDILAHIDRAIHIDMYGSISSLNVQQACAIALYHMRS